jgi:integrase
MGSLNYPARLEQQTQNIKQSEEISRANKELIDEFRRDLKLDGYSPARTHKLVGHIKKISEEFEYNLEATDKEDIKDITEWVEDRDIAGPTKDDYRTATRVFYRWEHHRDKAGTGLGSGEYPKKADWINTNAHSSGDEKLPDDLLSEEDVIELLSAAKNHRTKALMSLLWETGARIGELIDRNISDIREHEYGLQIVIEGKTGERRLPLISSVPHLREWMEKHPEGNSKKAPLWIDVQDQDHGNESETIEQVDYHALKKDIERTADRTDIDKPVNFHHWRHSRATDLAGDFTEAQMCEWFGWVQGSDMPAKYIHMSGRDIDSAYGELHDRVKEEEQEKKMKPKECNRCGRENGAEERFCGRCGSPLDPKTSLELRNQEEEMTSGATKEQLELAQAIIEATDSGESSLTDLVDRLKS